MEVYILDSLLRRTEVVDQFESLVWTERFQEIGDFELDLKSTLQNRSRFLTGTRIAINNSHRVMTVETVEDATADDGKETLKVKGRSLEALLQDRVIKATMSSTTDEPVWPIVDTPANVARIMFYHIARDGVLDPKDVIPFLQPGSIFPASTIPEPETEITWSQAPDQLYTAIKNVCDPYDLGFRLVRNFDTAQLYFDIYSGNDRTTRQQLLTPTIFSVGLDNIQNTTELTNIQGSKNVAYVFSPAGFVVVYGENVPPDISGFDRRVLVVDASDVQADDPDANTLMIQRGTEALNNARATALFDGEVNQYGTYVYGVDYDLGDIVEMRNRDGIITYKRVTEQIFASDASGDRSYPTLAADLFAGVDTWVSWNNDPRTWADFDADTTSTWATM